MRKVKITVSMVHFDGPLCGFVFTDSVCNVVLEHPFDEIRLNRLLTLYNKGTMVEEITDEPKVVAKVAAVEVGIMSRLSDDGTELDKAIDKSTKRGRKGKKQ